jgi:hypothetical protein
MRIAALATTAFIVAFASTGAHAQNYPWCAVYNMGDNAYNCGFATSEQCRATISGIGGFCERNPQYQPIRPYGR